MLNLKAVKCFIHFIPSTDGLELTMKWRIATTAGILGSVFYLQGCSPSVKLEAPEKPIEITMNVKIEHEIRLKVEKDVDELITSNKGLF